MSSGALKFIWETAWSLLVEDGSLAIGVIIALAMTWAAATILEDAAHNLVGWFLLAMLVGLVVLNLRVAGRSARHRIS